MAKKKPNKKKKDIYQDFEPAPDLEWTEKEEPKIFELLRTMSCTMVHVGLELGVESAEADRADKVNEIMDSGELCMPESEMLELMPDADIREVVKHFATKNYDTWVVNELVMMNIMNKLAEKVVYKIMNKLEKDGYLTLAWDEVKKDFVYLPGEKYKEQDKGDDWKKPK